MPCEQLLGMCENWRLIWKENVNGATLRVSLCEGVHEEPTSCHRRSLEGSLDKAGFEIASAPAAWEHFATNADTIMVVTNVPLSPSKTYVHVLATSNASAPAKKWAAAIQKAITESKLQLID